MPDPDENISIFAMNEKVLPAPIEDEMKTSYINYAMSVIVGRALPDSRDCFKKDVFINTELHTTFTILFYLKDSRSTYYTVHYVDNVVSRLYIRCYNDTNC